MSHFSSPCFLCCAFLTELTSYCRVPLGVFLATISPFFSMRRTVVGSTPSALATFPVPVHFFATAGQEQVPASLPGTVSMELGTLR